MTDGRISQLTVRSLTEGSDARISQFAGRSIINFPAEAGQISQMIIRSLDEPTPPARLSQLLVRAIIRGRVANPTIRVWTFTLDGHDFYVLRLGDSLTLVYDVYSEQWMDWADTDISFWTLATGINWVGGQKFGQDYGSNIVAGDDVRGLLWFLDPEQPYDEAPESGGSDIYFDRIVMGQVVTTGRQVVPCYATWLTTDMGDPAYTGAGITLEISDDAGQTFDDMGTVTVTAGEFNPEISWYSLGQIEAPGRLFRLTDDGAVARIDAFEMNDPDQDDDG